MDYGPFAPSKTRLSYVFSKYFTILHWDAKVRKVDTHQMAGSCFVLLPDALRLLLFRWFWISGASGRSSDSSESQKTSKDLSLRTLVFQGLSKLLSPISSHHKSCCRNAAPSLLISFRFLPRSCFPVSSRRRCRNTTLSEQHNLQLVTFWAEFVKRKVEDFELFG